MNSYAVFLRGVNISGKNKIPMGELKACLTRAGFGDVRTKLNSGNIVLTAAEADVREKVESAIGETFGLRVPVFVLPMEKLEDILLHAPGWWGTEDKNLYDNLIFILSDDTPAEIAALLGEPSEGLERVEIYRNVIFWTFDQQAYQKCSWWKRTAASGIADRLTIRTAGTLRKLTVN